MQKHCSTDIELLGWKGTTTHAGCVRFHHTDDIFDLEGAEGETRKDTTDAGVRRSHVLIGTVVDIEHEGICPFDENLLVLFLCIRY